MPRYFIRTGLITLTLLLSSAGLARAEMVTYLANLNTSKGNPVTDILILETDGTHPVHASVYPFDLPGNGTVFIRHDAPFAPTRSLLIGLTEGMDDDGSDKTQLVMFLDDNFAAANAGVLFSSVFPGARHSETIAKLLAAVAGDATQQAWFTDIFFHGPAAGAAFATGGSFTIAEFTGLDTIGASAASGNWMITNFISLPKDHPDAQSGLVTALIDEIAKVDKGPFDIALTLDDNGSFAIDKTVVNNTGANWTGFVMELGTGSGPGFVPSANVGQLGFQEAFNNREDTGAFPNVTVQGNRIVFTGALPAGGTAHFIVFAQSGTNAEHTITLRQRALCEEPVPALHPWALVTLVLLLAAIGGLRHRRIASNAARRN
jgi:hypothetical protein